MTDSRRNSSRYMDEKENLNLNLQNTINKQLKRDMNEIYKDKSDDIIIKTFIQCEDCEEILNDEQKLNQNYYDFSFNRYLQHLLKYRDIQNQMSSLDHIDNYDRCQHINRNRVFKHQKTLIKMVVGTFRNYSIQTNKYMVSHQIINNTLSVVL